MQPHHAMLGVPVSTKPKRRTVHLAPSTVHKKTKCSPDQVHIRELTVGQGGLGCAIWDGSIVLARWIHAHPEVFSNRVGMELGAGVGVPGIAAARHAARVVLTDYMEEVVSNLAYNLRLNANVECELEDDDETDETELARRRALRVNVRASGSSALLDWHAIDPDEEDLARMRENALEAAERLAAGQPSSAATTIACELDADTLASRLASLSFTPSSHFVDPTGLGPGSCDFLVGAELIYTYNKHHQSCFLRILSYYLRPGGVYYCVQSMNREGMPEFVKDLLEDGFEVRWQKAEAASGLVGSYRAEKAPKGFVQRDEQYVFYVIRKPGGEEPLDYASLALVGGELLDARVTPVPAVAMLRDAAAAEAEADDARLNQAGQKLVQEMLPKAFAQNEEASSSPPPATQ